MATALVDLDVVEAKADWLSSQRRQAWRSKPLVRFWANPPSGEESRGLILRGRLTDALDAKVSFTRREVTAGTVRLRIDHYLAKWIFSLPNDKESKKNVVMSVDHMGGQLRWSGILKDWKVTKEGGLYVVDITFIDDRQYLQTLLGAPNPLLPIWLIQFPRVLPGFGPLRWICSLFILANLMRVNNSLYSFPDDPFNWSSWTDGFDMSTWQVHITCPNLLQDSSLWGLIATRMDPLEAVIGDSVDMAQLSIEYRRIFTIDGEDHRDYGLGHVRSVRNGALVMRIVDNSGYYSPEGTAFGAGLFSGFYRSVVQFGAGLVEEYVADSWRDNTAVWEDSYYQSSDWIKGFLPKPTRPRVMIRDSKWSQIETSMLGYQPAGPAAVVVGGDNPYVDTMMELTIKAVGNILGYMFLAGFSSAGDLAATAVMPFLRGTVLAWLYWKNGQRATQSGWVHLYETRGGDGDQNAWTLSSFAALTGEFSKTKAQTVHQFKISAAGPVYPGIDFMPGYRVASTAEKIIPNHVFIDPVEAMDLTFGVERSEGHSYDITIGTGEVGKTFAEYFAKLYADSLDTLSRIGVRLVS